MDTGMLLESISDEAPCGVNLEYDNDFSRLEFLFVGEQETRMGDSVIEAQEPDWEEIVNVVSDNDPPTAVRKSTSPSWMLSALPASPI